MPSQPTPIAPKYRYYTVDLLTNQMLAEIPLRGVSYECALKAAGKFQGKIPITAETNSMDLYNSTMPGNTAIFAVRNGVCVWGGIIWSREYQFSTRDLVISASEFTSYFYHRKIWKTWNHQYGGTLAYNGSAGWQFTYENGSDVLVQPGSTVNFEFYEPENFKYNGNYRVAVSPSPSTQGFSLEGGADVADLTSYSLSNGVYKFYTKENHGYKTGDAITVTYTMVAVGSTGSVVGSPISIPMIIEVPGGPDSNYFNWNPGGSGNAPMTLITGTASRNLPTGIYNNVTVTVRMDTYDYIRSLIDSVFNDFVGSDFPNVYIEPGISYSFNVTSRRALNGYSILETDKPHNVAPGQAVQIKDVGPTFDGEFEVTDTPSPTTLVYLKGGNLPTETVTQRASTISKIQMVSGLATITTTAPHGYIPGNTVVVALGDAYQDFNGSWTIKDTPTTTSFRFSTGGVSNYDTITLTDATTSVTSKPTNKVTRVSVDSNQVSLYLSNPTTYAAGDSMTVSGVDRILQIKEKALDSQNSRATILTTEDHGLQVGDSVTISGLFDSANVVSKATTGDSVIMTTERPHNFRVGTTVAIDGLDAHKIVNKALTSNVATLTTEVYHNIPTGSTITVSDLRDSAPVQSRQLASGVARVTTTINHNFKINDQIVVDGLNDQYPIASKEAVNGYVTLTLDRPHNVQVGQRIVVSGVGLPFDGTDIEVDNITATRVMYNIDSKYWETQKAKAAANGQTLNIPANVPPAKSGGTLTATDSYYNGTFVLTGVGSNWVEYFRGGEDQPSAVAAGTNYTVSGPSVMNGSYVITGRTASTVSYSVTGNNVPSTVVPISSGDDAPVQPLITLPSIHTGNQIITAATSNTFTFSQNLSFASTQTTALTASQQSIFNGTRVITGVPTPKRFTFSLSGYVSSMLEQAVENVSHVRATSLYNGTFTIASVDPVNNVVKFNKTLPNYGSKSVTSRGRAVVSPVAIVSSFGPYPGNADIGLQYSSRGYAGVDVEPISYRGFELKSVGEALDSYSDNINGFEYRIDCSYDPSTNRFIKTFVLLSINFPDPPAPGEVAPLSRYGADKLVFEYPGGNITEVTISESAEESSTRFFAVGTTDLGPDAGPNIGVASSEELLRGKDGRMWPLLDASEQIDGVEDKNVLYSHAQRYLSESAPPFTNLSVSLNGSIAPFVGDYRPGDWCSLILNDPFARMRLQSDLEPRNDVVVRKIDSFQVNVPDGVTFPETVNLRLVAEWEIDKRGK